MEIELIPNAGVDDPASRAAVAALTREGFADDASPPGADGAWARAGLEEATDRDPTPSAP